MIPLPCVIMAGGKSSRMGSDKALLPFGGYETLTQYQLSRLSPLFQSLHVSAKNKEKFDFDASFIEDITTYKEHSPLVALLSILQKFQTPVAVLSVDTPFVSEEIFTRLFEQMDANTDAVIASSPASSHQLCAIYSPRICGNIIAMLERDEHKIRTLFNTINAKFIAFENDELFLNLNTQIEYAKAKDLL